MGNNSRYKVELTMKRKSKELEKQIVNVLAERMIDSLLAKQADTKSNQGKPSSINSKAIKNPEQNIYESKGERQ